MFFVFLQNLVLILVTLFTLVFHKADYTLFMSIVGILIASLRIMFTIGSASTKINYFLIQGLIFSLVIWYVLYPRQFSVVLG